MTETTESIHVLMVRVMRSVGAIGKTGFNAQQNFHFVGIDAVKQALHPALTEHGVYFVPDVLDRERLDFKTSKGTQMEAVHLHVRFTFYGPAGDSVSCSAWGEAADSGDKATGKAMSMALKSALLQAFCVPTEEDRDDPDAATVDRGEPDEDTVANLRARIAKVGAAKGLSLDQIATDFATTTGADIRHADLRSLRAYLDLLEHSRETAPPTDDELDAEAKTIRDLACDPDVSAEALAQLSLRAARARVLDREVTGFTGGTFPLREVLDERAKAKSRHPDEAAS